MSFYKLSSSGKCWPENAIVTGTMNINLLRSWGEERGEGYSFKGWNAFYALFDLCMASKDANYGSKADTREILKKLELFDNNNQPYAIIKDIVNHMLVCSEESPYKMSLNSIDLIDCYNSKLAGENLL